MDGIERGRERMARRRPLGVGVVWMATTIAVTGWVSPKTEQVTFGNAVMVGAAAGSQVAMVLDGRVISAPEVRGVIAGPAIIAGDFHGFTSTTAGRTGRSRSAAGPAGNPVVPAVARC